MVSNGTDSATSFRAWVVWVFNVRHPVTSKSDRSRNLLDLGSFPEFAECAWPAAIDDTLSSRDAHAFPQRGIGNQRPNGAREVIDITRLGDKTVRFVFYQLFRSAGIGDNDRHPGRLRFDDDVAEGVGRAGENKNIGRRVRHGQLFAREVAGKKCLRQRFRKRLGVRAVTNDKKLHGKTLIA